MARQGQADIARHVIQCNLNPRLLTQTILYDVASNMRKALSSNALRTLVS